MSVRQTQLVQMQINDMSEAVSMFGRKDERGQLPLVLVPSRSSCSWYMVIPDGVHVIMHRFGKDMGVQTAGFRILPPWYKVAFLVTKQSCAYNAPVMNCPTKDNVMVSTDLTLVFRITDASDFVYKLGALKFNSLLRSAAEESIRGLVRATTHDKVYELRGSRASEFIGNLNEKFKRFGVLFSDATITNVQLPHDLATTLETETTYDSKQKEEYKSHQYQLKVLNDEAELSLKKLVANNDRLAQDEVARKERALIQKGQSEIEAQRKKQLAIIKAEEEAAVMKYKAESEYINAKIQGEKEAQMVQLKAEGESAASKIAVDQYALTEKIRAEALVVSAENAAKTLEVEGEAEAKAAAQLKERREFELQMQRLDMLRNLALKGKIVISGENGDNLIKALTSGDTKGFTL